jgi:hypothetical protein
MKNSNVFQLIGLVCVISLGSSCSSLRTDAAQNHFVKTGSPIASPTVLTDQSNQGMNDVDVEGLCNKLREIKTIPYDPSEKTGDPVHDGLMTAGLKAVPCLVERITDTEKTENAYVIPEAPNFRVGDAAVFMLIAITGQSWVPSEMFPPKYAEMFKTEGMYAYFAYVEKPENRKKFQNWWKNWMRDNLKN